MLIGSEVYSIVTYLLSENQLDGVEASNVINDPKCDKGPKCYKFWP